MGLLQNVCQFSKCLMSIAFHSKWWQVGRWWWRRTDDSLNSWCHTTQYCCCYCCFWHFSLSALLLDIPLMLVTWWVELTKMAMWVYDQNNKPSHNIETMAILNQIWITLQWIQANVFHFNEEHCHNNQMTSVCIR